MALKSDTVCVRAGAAQTERHRPNINFRIICPPNRPLEVLINEKAHFVTQFWLHSDQSDPSRRHAFSTLAEYLHI